MVNRFVIDKSHHIRSDKVKTPRGPEPSRMEVYFNSVKSMERGIPVPRTRNFFRKSIEPGEEQAPKAVVLRQEWKLKTRGEPSRFSIVKLRGGKRWSLYRFSTQGMHFLVMEDHRIGELSRSAVYTEREWLMAAYDDKTLSWLEREPLLKGS